MSVTTIANRYARALADVIVEQGETAAVAEEVNGFANLLAQNSELRDVFASPVIALDRKRAILNELLARLSLRPTTNNFLQVLLKNQRLHQIDVVQTSLATELDVRGGIVSAQVTTARPLATAQQDALANQLCAATGKQVRVEYKIDPDIIGGVVTRIGSLIYDGSIKNQLALMKQQLSGS